MNVQKPKVKPFAISKKLIFKAYEKVKANKGAAGVDKQSIANFEENLKDNLYLLWNRMSSGCYFPPPVRAVEIPKKDKGIRTLGIPTVADRIGQTAVAMLLEKEVEPLFHPDSYAYRPKGQLLTQSVHADSGAGRRTGLSISTSKRSSTAFLMTNSWRWSNDTLTCAG